MKRWRPFVPVLALVATLAVACTGSRLQILPEEPATVLDNKLTVEGEVCTQRPEDLVFPMRVLFLVDASESMAVVDPPDPATAETHRERAVRETAERLLETSGGDVEISVVRFSSQAQPLTPTAAADGTFSGYFTSDLDQLRAALPQLAVTDRTTNFVSALAEAYAEIRHELINADRAALALSTYHVILISDGIPDIEGNGSARANILDAVRALQELAELFHVGNLSLSTALLTSGNAGVDAAASALLEEMAEVGGGTHRAFFSGGELSFLYVDLTSLRRVFTLRSLVVHNINAATLGDVVYPDSDGDGLPDEVELAIASSPFDPDTDGDGCRDSVEYAMSSSGLDPIDPADYRCRVPDLCLDRDDNGVCDCPQGEPEGSCCTDADQDGYCDCIDLDADGRCDAENYEDSDGDGLFDCEEALAGSHRLGPDSDGDGLVDFLEFRFGTKPDEDDTNSDFDWDGVSNGEEVKTSSDPRFDSSRGRSQIAYRYKVSESRVDAGSTCYEFRVSNVTLTGPVSTEGARLVKGPAGQGYSGANRIIVYAGEVPFDDLQSYASFRVACVEGSFNARGNYKNPPSGVMRVSPDDFVALDAFVADDDCVRPGDRP